MGYVCCNFLDTLFNFLQQSIVIPLKQQYLVSEN